MKVRLLQATHRNLVGGVFLEQIALAWARAARVSIDEMQLAAWRDAAHAEVRRSSRPTCRSRRGLKDVPLHLVDIRRQSCCGA